MAEDAAVVKGRQIHKTIQECFGAKGAQCVLRISLTTCGSNAGLQVERRQMKDEQFWNKLLVYKIRGRKTPDRQKTCEKYTFEFDGYSQYS